jgi:hypothetical protein
LNEICTDLRLRTEDLEKFLEDERAYLETRPEDDDEIALSAEYILLLEKLADAKLRFKFTTDRLIGLIVS